MMGWVVIVPPNFQGVLLYYDDMRCQLQIRRYPSYLRILKLLIMATVT